MGLFGLFNQMKRVKKKMGKASGKGGGLFGGLFMEGGTTGTIKKPLMSYNNNTKLKKK